MKNLKIIEHPLIQHKLTILRNVKTCSKEFKEAANEIATLLCYEATRNLSLKEVEIRTPITVCKTKKLAGEKLAVVCILRSGLAMLDGILKLIPYARVGHIGIYRDPDTMTPVEYYCKLPSDIAEREVLLLEPMIATGGTTSAAIQFIKDHGAKKIHMLTIIASEEGVKSVCEEHPDVEVCCAALDEDLTGSAYISPGLGDFGARAFGTK